MARSEMTRSSENQDEAVTFTRAVSAGAANESGWKISRIMGMIPLSRTSSTESSVAMTPRGIGGLRVMGLSRTPSTESTLGGPSDGIATDDLQPSRERRRLRQRGSRRRKASDSPQARSRDADFSADSSFQRVSSAPTPSGGIVKGDDIQKTFSKTQRVNNLRVPHAVYSGEESQPGIPNGLGLLATKSGHRYRGNWNQGRLHGFARCLSPSGRSYEGDWKDGVPGGFGTLKQKDGTVEKGEFKDGKLHGTGTKSQPSTGMEYTGHFYQGTPDGFGKIQLANGDWFEGNWSAGTPLDGKGRVTHSDLMYIGELKTWQYHGNGELIYSDCGMGGVITKLWTCKGNWVEGKFDGFGVKENHVHAWRYEGQWVQDEMTVGKKVYADGDVFEGSFVDEVPHGQCKYTRTDGQYLEGKWTNGNFVEGETCKHFPNGAIYVGGCVGETIHGAGVMTWLDGRRVTGVFNHGNFPEHAQMADTTGVVFDVTFKGLLGTKMGLWMGALSGKLPNYKVKRVVPHDEQEALMKSFNSSMSRAPLKSPRMETRHPNALRAQEGKTSKGMRATFLELVRSKLSPRA